MAKHAGREHSRHGRSGSWMEASCRLTAVCSCLSREVEFIQKEDAERRRLEEAEKAHLAEIQGLQVRVKQMLFTSRSPPNFLTPLALTRELWCIPGEVGSQFFKYKAKLYDQKHPLKFLFQVRESEAPQPPQFGIQYSSSIHQHRVKAVRHTVYHPQSQILCR